MVLAQGQAARADSVRAQHVYSKSVEAIRTKDLDVVRTAFTEHRMRSAVELIPLLDTKLPKKE